MSPSLVVASSVEEVLDELNGGARAVAGGTDLVVGARQGKAPLPERLVAIHSLDELTGMQEVDGVLRLGALVTHRELAGDELVRERLTALADACGIVGSHATRAQGTVGGNLMNASPAMESGGPLLCFDAVALLRSASAMRTLGIAELLAGPGGRPRHRVSCWRQSRCRSLPRAPAAATCGSSTAARWRSRSSAPPPCSLCKTAG